MLNGNPENQAYQGGALDFRAADKWAWFDAVYAEQRFTGAEKAVLGWLAVKAVFTGRDTFRIRQSTVAARTGEGERTVRRAYKRARELGYLEVAQERQRGRSYTRADEHRLKIPDNLTPIPDGIADRIDRNTGQDRQEYRTGSPRIPDRIDRNTGHSQRRDLRR